MGNPLPYFYQLHGKLVESQQDRDLLPMAFVNNDVTPYWNTYEMLIMMREVNFYRRKFDAPLISWEDIKQAESRAAGHIDYTKKFALYCAELVVS